MTAHVDPVADRCLRWVRIVVIAAVAENGVIGRAGALPWRLKSDLLHFRDFTWGKPVVMGRRTYASIGRPLPGRTNIVLTGNRNFGAPGVIFAPDLTTALAVGRGDALRRGVEEIVVAGGAEIYARVLPIAHRMVLTSVHMHADGDIRFPAIDPEMWEEAARTEHLAGPGDDAAFARIRYERTRRHAAPDSAQPV